MDDNSDALTIGSSIKQSQKQPYLSIFPPSGFGRNSWISILIWLIPVIFALGTAYKGFSDSGDAVKINSSKIDELEKTQNDMRLNQRGYESDSKFIQDAIKDIKKDLYEISCKLDKMSEDVSAIKARKR